MKLSFIQAGPGGRRLRGFTLVEILMVVLIIGIIAALGVPSFVRVFQKNPFRQAVTDVLGACQKARARAIVTGLPAELIITGEGDLEVQGIAGAAPPPVDAAQAPSIAGPVAGAASSQESFKARLGQNVKVILLDVNFVDHMEMEEARVRFHPNGTSDEFSIVLESESGSDIRRIFLEVMTGLADVEVIK